MLRGQRFQFAAEAQMVRAAGIFGADGDGILVRFLLGGDDGHIYSEQIVQIGRKAGGRAVSHFFVIADVNGGVLGRRQAGLGDGLDRAVDAGHAGLVVQVAGADEAVFVRLYARVKGDDVADADAQAAGFFFAGGGGVDAHFHVFAAAFGVLFFPGVGVDGGGGGQEGAPVGAAVAGKYRQPFPFHGTPAPAA